MEPLRLGTASGWVCYTVIDESLPIFFGGESLQQEKMS